MNSSTGVDVGVFFGLGGWLVGRGGENAKFATRWARRCGDGGAAIPHIRVTVGLLVLRILPVFVVGIEFIFYD